MKIFSRQYIKAALVAFGLLAVLLAYRSNGSKNTVQKSSLVEPIRISDSRDLPEFEQNNPNLTSIPLAESDYPATTGFTDFDKVFQGNTVVPLTDLPMAVEPKKDESTDLSALTIEAESTAQPELPLDETAFSEAQIETGFEASNEAATVDFIDRKPAPAPPVSYAVPVFDDAAAQKAVHHIEYGKSLARRNATEAAGQEFLGALRVLAEANDTSVGGNRHVSALRNGLLAIREASDFKTDDPQRQIVMNVANIIESHETRVLGMQEARTISASLAMRRYFEYAGQQLGMCGGQNPVAAEALYCLGKMRTITSQGNPDPESIEIYESIIFHHASLASDPGNFRSANELGVLLARSGHLDAAETYLKNSLRLNPSAQSWANLAKVHQRKGTQQDQQLANLAMQEYQTAMARPTIDSGQGPIIWVEPEEFIARSPVQLNSGEFTPNQNSANVVPVTNVQSEGEDPSLVERIGSLFIPKNFKR